MQSVHITTDIVSSNLDKGEIYNIMWSSLSVTCDRSVVFSGSSGFLHQYNWNIVESSVKHYETNKQTSKHTFMGTEIELATLSYKIVHTVLGIEIQLATIRWLKSIV